MIASDRDVVERESRKNWFRVSWEGGEEGRAAKESISMHKERKESIKSFGIKIVGKRSDGGSAHKSLGLAEEEKGG